MKMSFHSHVDKTHFRMKGFARGLVLKKRHKRHKEEMAYFSIFFRNSLNDTRINEQSLFPLGSVKDCLAFSCPEVVCIVTTQNVKIIY